MKLDQQSTTQLNVPEKETIIELNDRVHLVRRKTIFLLLTFFAIAGASFGFFKYKGLKQHAAPITSPSSTDLPKVSFYHWRTVYQPGEVSLNRLMEMNSDRLYLRLFEITIDKLENSRVFT